MPKVSVLQTVIHPKPQSPPESGSPFHVDSAKLEEEVWGNDPDEMDAMLGVLVENVPVALAMFDLKLRYLLANRQWITDFGLQDELPLVGRSQFEVFPNLHPGWRSVYDRALQGHVVRSENDVTEGPDGLPMIFRWEVRPWRKGTEAKVGGVMVTCEKFSLAGMPEAVSAVPAEGEAATEAAPAPAPVAPPVSVPVQAETHFVDCDLPMLLADADGVILKGNDPAHRLFLSRGLQEGVTQFWDVFGNDQTSARLRGETLGLIARTLEGKGKASTSIKVRIPGGAPERFMLWALSRAEPRENVPQVLMVGLMGEDPPVAAAPVMPVHTNTSALETTFQLEKRHLEDQIATATNELKLLRDMEQAFKRRELRQREVLDTMPCGLIVLDERGRPTFHNAHVRDLFGQELKPGDAVEDWLMHACLNEGHREEVSRIWRESVWRRQLTKVVSLSTADGLLKDFEFRPAPLPNNGLLLTVHDVTDTCRLEEMLRSTEAKFRTLLHESPGAMVLTDPTGSIFEVNPAAERLLGHPKAELRRTSIDDWLTAESVHARRAELQRLVRGTQAHASLPITVRTGRDHEEQAATLKLAAIYDAEGKLHSTAHFLELPKAEPVAAAAPVAAGLFDSAPAAVMPAGQPVPEVRAPGWVRLLQASSQGKIGQWTEEAEALFGWTADEARQRWLHQLFSPSDATGFYAELQTRLDDADDNLEAAWYGKEGRRGNHRFQVRWADDGDHVDLNVWDENATIVAPQEKAAAAVSSAVTVSPQTGAWWPEADMDRERLMLTETHHRITNHLQLISSLLNLQSNAVEDETARQALRSSQNRVRAIAVLHQHLYALAMGQAGSLEEFTTGLVEHLRQCFGVAESRVAVRLELQDTRIHDEWVMPIALILNEAISNAFKHAFPDERSGLLEIRLSVNDQTGHLTVQDNGIGLAPGFDAGQSLGLGLKVIGVFAEQMRGQVSLKNMEDIGLRFSLHFPIACVDN